MTRSLTLLICLVSSVIGQTATSKAAVKRVVGMEYPWFARMAALQGTVELVANLSRAGEIGQIHVVSGPEPLATPAKQTLSRWQFTACKSEGDDCTMKFVFLFILDGSCSVSSHCPTDFTVDLPDKITVRSKLFESAMVGGQTVSTPRH